MKKMSRLICGLVGIILMSTTNSVWASESWYVEGLAGYNHQLAEHNGALVSGALGYEFDNGFRTELEVSYRNANPSNESFVKDKYGFISGMTNVWYDIPIGNLHSVHPYVGAGIGVAHVQIDSTDTSDSYSTQPAFAAQFGGGVDFTLSPSLVFAFDVRRLRTGNVHYEETSPGSGGTTTSGASAFGTVDVSLALRYAFGGAK